MSERVEPGQRAPAKLVLGPRFARTRGALRTAMKTFSGRALALNRIFSRTVKDAVPGNFRFHEDKADLSAVPRTTIRGKADAAQGVGGKENWGLCQSRFFTPGASPRRRPILQSSLHLTS